tara:strand:- start:602 stop:838 length:237 start_codon:yes stop_codon:yes gene_type:complete
MPSPLTFSEYKNFIRSQNLTSDQLQKRYIVMNDMVNQEIANAKNKFSGRPNKGVISFLTKRAKFLADEAMDQLQREIV